MVCDVRLHYNRTEYNFELEILFDPEYMFYSGRPYLVALETGYKGNQVHGETQVSLHIYVVDCCMADLAEFVGSSASKCFKQVFTVIRMNFLPSLFEKLG